MKTDRLFSENSPTKETDLLQDGQCDAYKPAAASKLIVGTGIPYLELIKSSGIPELTSPLAD